MPDYRKTSRAGSVIVGEGDRSLKASNVTKSYEAETGCTIYTDSNGTQYYASAIQNWFFYADNAFYPFASTMWGELFDVILTDGTCIHFVAGDSNATAHTNGGDKTHEGSPLSSTSDLQWIFAPMKYEQYRHLFGALAGHCIEIWGKGEDYSYAEAFRKKYNIGNDDDQNHVAYYRMYNAQISNPPTPANNDAKNLSYSLGQTVGSGATKSSTKSSSNTKYVSGAIDKAVEEALKIANDNSHGYNNIASERFGQNGDYSCAGLVLMSWERAGVPLYSEGGAWGTGDFEEVCLKYGFKDVTNEVDLRTGKGVKKGDIVLCHDNPGHSDHVELCIDDDGSLVGAKGNSDGKPGDSSADGHEIMSTPWWDDGWNYCFRYAVDDEDEDVDNIYTLFDWATLNWTDLHENIRTIFPVLKYFTYTTQRNSISLADIDPDVQTVLKEVMNTWPSNMEDGRRALIAKAASLVNKGCHYSQDLRQPGSEVPSYLDCSAYVAWAYTQIGQSDVDVGAYTGTFVTASYFKSISESDLIPGDIGLNNSSTKGGNDNHVGIFIGKNSDGSNVWLHCTSSGINGPQVRIGNGGFTVFYRYTNWKSYNGGDVNDSSLTGEYKSDKGALTNVSKYIFVGDFRTSGMQQAVNTNSYSSWITQSDADYKWLNKTASKKIEKEIKENCAVIISLGFNDLDNVNKYISKINSLAKKWKDKGVTVYFSSIGPTSGSSKKMNDAIQTFNNKMKNGLNNVGFIDIYSTLKNEGFSTKDGKKYSDSTYQKIYNKIKDSISSGTKNEVVSEVTVDMIEKAVQNALTIAKDKSHGYYNGKDWQTTRQNDYNCVMFVLTAWEKAGVPVGVWSVKSLPKELPSVGFTDVTSSVDLKSGSGLQKGDILIACEDNKSHVEMYYGDGKTIGAREDIDGKEGESKGEEISTWKYSKGDKDNLDWDYVFRYNTNNGNYERFDNSNAEIKISHYDRHGTAIDQTNVLYRMLSMQDGLNVDRYETLDEMYFIEHYTNLFAVSVGKKFASGVNLSLYFDTGGINSESVEFEYPLKDAKLKTSYKEYLNVIEKRGYIDVITMPKDKVVSPYKGVVTTVEKSMKLDGIDEYVSAIDIQFNDSTYIEFMGFAKDSVKVKVGDKVKKGQELGTLVDSSDAYLRVMLHHGLKVDDPCWLFGITNETSGVLNPADPETIKKKLQTLANWWIKNIPTYQGSTQTYSPIARTYYDCDLINTKVGDDCSGFGSAFMEYVCGHTFKTEGWSWTMVKPDGTFAKEVAKYGWKAYSSDEIGDISNLKTGDVLVANSDGGDWSYGGHVEVYVDKNHTWGWGCKNNGYPLANSIYQKKSKGHIVYTDSGHGYITVYRYVGTTS